MKAYQLKRETVSRRKIEAYWKRDELCEFLQRQYREKRKKPTTVIGVRARDLLEEFYTEGDSLMEKRDDWRSDINNVLMDCLSRAGFSMGSAIENRTKPVKIDKTRGEWMVKIELFPVRPVFF